MDSQQTLHSAHKEELLTPSGDSSIAPSYETKFDSVSIPENLSHIDEKLESIVPESPLEVTWDGDADPENPRNWPKWKKWYEHSFSVHI